MASNGHFDAVYANEADGSRTRNHRIDSPIPQDDKANQEEDLQQAATTSYTPAYTKSQKNVEISPRDGVHADRDLAQVAQAWPALPKPIRTAILALIQSAETASNGG